MTSPLAKMDLSPELEKRDEKESGGQHRWVVTWVPEEAGST